MPTQEEQDYLRKRLDEDYDCVLHIPSIWHYQVKEEQEVRVNWWPSKGTVMTADGQHGPRCATIQAFLDWFQGWIIARRQSEP